MLLNSILTYKSIFQVSFLFFLGSRKTYLNFFFLSLILFRVLFIFFVLFQLVSKFLLKNFNTEGGGVEVSLDLLLEK
jgi:hypothetical protein